MPLLEETECVIQLLALLEVCFPAFNVLVQKTPMASNKYTKDLLLEETEWIVPSLKTCKPLKGTTGDLWDGLTLFRVIPNGLTKYLPWDDIQCSDCALFAALGMTSLGWSFQNHTTHILHNCGSSIPHGEVDCIDKNSEALELYYNIKLPLKYPKQWTMEQKEADSPGGTVGADCNPIGKSVPLGGYLAVKPLPLEEGAEDTFREVLTGHGSCFDPDLTTVKLMGPATERTLSIASSYLPYDNVDFTPSREIAALVNPVGMSGLELVVAMPVHTKRSGTAQNLQQRCVGQD
ncbi:hypothetical protein J6590_081879 [Homalodisca vitripennis]|nr:hypothetical protein J6590_081879 [Homalodisca vitripennis]